MLIARLRPEDALAQFERVLELEPRSVQALYWRGLALKALNRFDESIASQRRALEVEPAAAAPQLQIGVVSLCRGDFDAGWRGLEWRWRASPSLAALRKSLRGARWNGEPRAGTTVVLHAGQGLGDTIQFARYVPLVAARGVRIVLGVQSALEPLLRDLAGVAQVVTQPPYPAYDCHCPLLSLPLVFGTQPHSVPAHLPYLSAPRERHARWAARLGERRRPRVGIAWRGQASPGSLDERALTLQAIAPLLALRAVDWVVLQKRRTREEAAWLGAQPGLLDVGAELTDFADTAAVAAQLDLVISVDTSVAHLAGALGRPLWVLLPYARGWRWLERDGASLWYPGARLFRQAAPGDWDGVLARVRAALEEWALASTVRCTS